MEYIFIATSYRPGNAVYEYYKALGKEFNDQGYKVLYIFDQHKKNIPNNSENTKYYSWPSKRPTTFKDFLYLKRLLEKYKPTHCISTFGAVNIVLLTSYLYKVKNRIAWIRTTQTQILIDSKSRIKSKILAFIKSLFYSFSTQIITNSEGTKQDSINEYGIKKEKITVLFNLKNKTKIEYYKKEKRDFSIVIVGRLDKSKGHAFLFRQFKIVLKKYPNLKLIVVGTGILLEDLKSLVQELNISENINFHGNIHRSLIGEVFAKSLIGVSSSVSEAFGWTNIESLNEGTPIISTKTEGATDIIKPKVNGEFFYHDDEISLLCSIESIFANWDKYSIEAKKTFENHFSIEEVLKYHSKIILGSS